MRLASFWWGLTLGSSLCLLGACSDGNGAAPPPRSDGGTRDTGTLDGTVLPDSGGSDASNDGGTSGSCVVDSSSDVFDLGSETGLTDRRLAMAPGPDGVLVLWALNTGGAVNVSSRYIASTGTVPAAQPVTDDFYTSRDPAVARVGSSYVAAWVDNDTMGDGFEIEARPLAADGSPAGSTVRVTNNALPEQSLAMAPMGAGAVLVWVEVDTAMGERRVMAQLLDADGNPTGSPQTVRSDPSVGRPAVAALSSGALVSWVESTAPDVDGGAAGQRVALQVLDTSLAPASAQAYADAQMNAAGSVGLAMATGGGGAVFGVRVAGVRPEVRWRHLSEAGATTGAEVPVTATAAKGTDPSIAPFRGGFAVAYRVLDDVDLTSPAIRLTLLDNTGARVSFVDVADTTADGSQTTVVVGIDGNPVVGWTEQDAIQTHVRVARMRCGS